MIDVCGDVEVRMMMMMMLAMMMTVMMMMIIITMMLASIYRLHFHFFLFGQTCSIVGISLKPPLSALVPVAGAGLHIGSRLEAWRREMKRDGEVR
jgi:hypothetical protein